MNIVLLFYFIVSVSWFPVGCGKIQFGQQECSSKLASTTNEENKIGTFQKDRCGSRGTFCNKDIRECIERMKHNTKMSSYNLQVFKSLTCTNQYFPQTKLVIQTERKTHFR